MKVLKHIILAITMVTLISFRNSTDKKSADKKGFTTIETAFKNKFGDNAYYRDVTAFNNKSVGNIIGVTLTEAPESLKMRQWNNTQGNWKQNSDISLEVPQGSKASDFVSQLNDKINLSKLGESVEKPSKQLAFEKNIQNLSYTWLL